LLSESSFRVLQHRCNCGITKDFIHLLECAALGLGVEEYIAETRDEIKEEEEIEIVKADIS
jgi:hypothetical protein